MEKQLREKGNKTRSSIYGFIVDFITTNGYSPSIREIAEGTGIGSTATVHDHLYLLEQLGKIHTQEGKPRTISVSGYKYVRMKTEEK